jgi:hypothetical protein
MSLMPLYLRGNVICASLPQEEKTLIPLYLRRKVDGAFLHQRKCRCGLFTSEELLMVSVYLSVNVADAS